MTVRLHILTACGLAILAGLAIASAVAAHGRLPGGGAGRSASAGAGAASRSPTAATATPTAPATSEPEASATPGASQPELPVPKEAQPSTDALPIAGPGSLLQRQPTPKPHRPTVILDPGHGRGDPGAVHYTADGTVDLTEAEANLSIAGNLRRFLEEKGYDVYVTRDGFGKRLSSGPLAPVMITADLFSRVHLASAVDGDVFVSIHNNGSTNPNQSGTEIWYCGESKFGGDSAHLADLVLDAAVDGLNQYGYSTVRRGTQEDSTVHQSAGFCQFLVTREVQMPAVLTELLFLTNDADAAVLKDESAREAMAERIADAIDQFMRERGFSPAS